MATATLYVCTTCRRAEAPDAPRPGEQLLRQIEAQIAPVGVTVVGVECLSACNNGCSVALTAPGKWSYVYGNLDPMRHAEAIVEGAALYARSNDGIVPWRQRPEIFRKQSLARIPPVAGSPLPVSNGPALTGVPDPALVLTPPLTLPAQD
jgi:predicted metal-binding protein